MNTPLDQRIDYVRELSSVELSRVEGVFTVRLQHLVATQKTLQSKLDAMQARLDGEIAAIKRALKLD